MNMKVSEEEGKLRMLGDGSIQGPLMELAKHIRGAIKDYEYNGLKDALAQVNTLMAQTSKKITAMGEEVKACKDKDESVMVEEGRLYQIACYQELHNIRKVIHDKLAESKKYNKTAPTPNNIIHNLIATPELVKTFGEIWDYSGGGVPVTISGIEMSETFQNQLAKPETPYIIDAIGYYVNKYREAGGNTTEIQYHPSEEWDSFMVTDTFDNICTNCRAEGQIRNRIREVLFGKERPLQYVTLFLTDPNNDKVKLYRKVQFINAVSEEGKKTQPGGWYANKDMPSEGTKIGKVTLQVSARLYRCIGMKYIDRQKREIEIDISGGYHMRPLAFTDTVKKMFESMRRLDELAEDGMKLGMKSFDSGKGLAAVTAIKWQWDKGLQNRTTDMVVTHNGLEEGGYLPTYSHKSKQEQTEKQYRNLDAIARVIAEIIRFKSYKDAFPKCIGTYVNKNDLSIVLILEKKDPPASTAK